MHRLVVDLLRADDGRLEGTVTTETGREHPFSGTLEMLRILEDLDAPDAPDASSGPDAAGHR